MASEDSILKALLGGGGAASTSGSADVNAFNRTLRENDYWSKAGNMIGGVKFDDKTWSPGQTLAASAGQAFLSTILDSIGQSQERKQTELMAQALPELYRNPEQFVAPVGVDSMAVNALKMAAIQKEAERDAAREEKKASSIDQIRQQFFTQRPDLAMRELGISDPLEQVQEDSILNAPAPMDMLSKGLSSGGMTPAEKLIAYNKEFSKTMPRTQAAKAASEQIASEMKMNKDSVDAAKTSREYGQQLLDLSNTADNALTAIGPTGGLFEKPRELKDFLASSVLGDEEAKGRRTGRQLLESTAPQIVKMGKSPGAVTDYENKLIIKSFANLGNEPEANALLVGKMQALGELHQDYADFLEAYKAINGGTVSGADKKWAEYRKSVPLLVGEGEDIEVNTNRPSWKDFFSGEYSSASPSNGSDLPQVGGMFQGGKVRRVTRTK